MENTSGKVRQGRKGSQCKELKGQVSAVDAWGSVLLGACRDSRVSLLMCQGVGVYSSRGHVSLAKGCPHA